MPSFGARSRSRLATCDPRLVRLFEDVVTVYDCSVECGARSVDEQLAAIASGHSKLTDPFASLHVVGPARPLALAVDVAPYPVVWPDMKTMKVREYVHAIGRFYHFAGVVRECARLMSLPIRWGGDWDSDLDFNDQTFDDLDHFEIVA